MKEFAIRILAINFILIFLKRLTDVPNYNFMPIKHKTPCVMIFELFLDDSGYKFKIT